MAFKCQSSASSKSVLISIFQIVQVFCSRPLRYKSLSGIYLLLQSLMQSRLRQKTKKESRMRGSQTRVPSVDVTDLISLANQGTIPASSSLQPPSPLHPDEEDLQKARMKNLTKMLNQIICQKQEIDRATLFQIYRQEYHKRYSQTRDARSCKRRFNQILRVMRGIEIVQASRTLVSRKRKDPLVEMRELKQIQQDAKERINSKLDLKNHKHQSKQILNAHLQLNKQKGDAGDEEKIRFPFFFIAQHSEANNRIELTLNEENQQERGHSIYLRGYFLSRQNDMDSLHYLYPQGTRVQFFKRLKPSLDL